MRRSQGNQVLFQANAQSPIFPEIKSLITKTVGVHDVIRSSLAPLGTEIRIAFIYGSVARQQERGNSDIDLMVLGSAPFGEEEHYSVPKADPVSIVRFLIEQQHLTQRDLIPQFGSESAVSMFMTGERNLTLEQVRKLSTRFKLPTDVFIPKASVPRSPKQLAKGRSRSR